LIDVVRGYFTKNGEARELATVRCADGSTLVVDYLAGTHADARLIAHLAADEPQNAHVVCEMYLADETRGRCRRVIPQDLESAPEAAPPASDTSILDANGDSYIIQVVFDRDAPRAGTLRWTLSEGREEDFTVLTLRNVIGALEGYEPARSLTINAIAAPGGEGPSVKRLRAELRLLDESPTLLNRGLREAVLDKVARGELTYSEIAIRCGRVNHARRGVGDTSWLKRRIGLMPERAEPTPWIHTKVFALIVRDGLGCSPHEIGLTASGGDTK
jgi:hypothetical protein